MERKWFFLMLNVCRNLHQSRMENLRLMFLIWSVEDRIYSIHVDFFDFSSLSSIFIRLINWLSSLPTLPTSMMWGLQDWRTLPGLTCHGLEGGRWVPHLHLPSPRPPLLLAGEVPPPLRPGRGLHVYVRRSLPGVVVELVSEEQIASRGTLITCERVMVRESM